jgi:hypothetical protein
MKWGISTRTSLGLVLAAGFALDGGLSRGQVVERERDTTITGPRGRSIERSIATERGPGFVDRQVNIQRPGGTFHSNTLVERAPSVIRGAGGFGPAGRFNGWGPGPRPFFGREVIINNGGGGGSWIAPLAVGLGSFGVGMLAGSALAAPPPPVVAAPPPVVVVPPGGYVVQPAPAVVAGAAVPPGPPPGPVVDPLADALGRLQSYHAHSRRDGCYTLGRLRDPRALPALIDRLKVDTDADVRIAAATALGEIGDPRAAVYLERVTVYDKKEKVRDAAALALSRLPRELPPQPGRTQVAPAPAPAPMVPAASPPASVPPQPQPIERVPPPPTPAFGGPGFPERP